MTDLTPVAPQLRAVSSAAEELVAALDEAEMVGRADDGTISDLKSKLDAYVGANRTLQDRVRRQLPLGNPGVNQLLAAIENSTKQFASLSDQAGLYLQARTSFHETCQNLSGSLSDLRNTLRQLS